MSRMSRATPNKRALARVVRVNSPPWSVVAADKIGKIVATAFERFGGLFARPVKHVPDTPHNRIVATPLFVLNISFAMIFDHCVHRRTGKHSFSPRHCSLVRTDVNCAYRPMILIL